MVNGATHSPLAIRYYSISRFARFTIRYYSFSHTPTQHQNAMDATSIFLIVIALVGFFVLAAVLLVPVYIFLQREKKASEQWTPEALARRLRETPPSPNGSHQHDPAREKQTDG